MKFKITIEKGKDGYIVAHCPALKGCWSQGKTESQAMKNIREAIQLYLEPDPLSIRPSRSQKVRELIV